MSGRLHAIQIVASLDSEAAGPSYSVRRLAEALAARGVVSETFSTGTRAETERAGVRTRVFAGDFAGLRVVSRLAFSRGLCAALHRGAASGAVLHTHGLWMMPNVYPGWVAASRGGALIVSPRGMLGQAALRFSRRKKQVFWALAQGRAVARAKCLHATSQQEYDEIRSFGLVQPVAVVPNGIDVASDDEVAAGRGLGATRVVRTVLYLGRVHEKKGIDQLIEAWARLEPGNPDWRLRIVGPSERGHGEELRRRASALGLARVTFEDGLFGADKDSAYREADLFVLPTRNENFGLVVAEALANGTPVITTKGAPWAGLRDRACGWWIDFGVEALAAALADAMAKPRPELNAMGARGRTWMRADFSWESVASDMERVYRWCTEGGDRPDCVVAGK
jgi:glycosyltransferase involved in cell wall biosynthesis